VILYTIATPEQVWQGPESRPRPVEIPLEGGARFLIVEPQSHGMAKVVRLVSTDPADYLDERWSPHRMIGPLPGLVGGTDRWEGPTV